MRSFWASRLNATLAAFAVSTCFFVSAARCRRSLACSSAPSELGPRRFSLETIEVGGSFCGRSRLDRCLELESARLCGVLGGFGLQCGGFGFELPGLSRAHLQTGDQGGGRRDDHHHEQQHRQLPKSRARVRFLFGPSALFLGLRLRFRALPALHVARPPVEHRRRQNVVENLVADAGRLVRRRGHRDQDSIFARGQLLQQQSKGVRRHAGVVGKIGDGMRNLRARRGHEMVEYPRGHFGFARRQAAHRRVQMGADDLLRPAQAVRVFRPA